MTAQTQTSGSEKHKAPVWRQALKSLELPALAMITALAVGSIIIVLTDLTALQAFRDTFGRLAPTGWVRLGLALVSALAAMGVYFFSEQILKRFLKSTHTWPGAVIALRWVGAVVGLALAILFLRAAGFAEAVDAGWGSVRLAYGAMLEGSLGNFSKITAALQSGDAQARREAFYPMLESLVAATPFIFAGLAVAVGFQCGLFNIGAEGQLFMGAIFSVYVGYTLKGLPAIVHIPLALGAGALGGAVWAFLPALLKAKVGTHEVINTIMLNWIAIRLSEWLLRGPMMAPGQFNPISAEVELSARLPRFFADPIRFHLGFFVALAAAAFVYWLLFRTTWGFEIRTVGANPHAAKYAGMSITRNYLIAFCLSGALAGLAGANEVLGVNHNLALAFSAGTGFDAIALALLGNSHPVGVVFAALLFGTLRSGGTRMQNIAKIPVDIIFVVQALVIAFIAAPAIIRALYRYRDERRTAAK